MHIYIYIYTRRRRQYYYFDLSNLFRRAADQRGTGGSDELIIIGRVGGGRLGLCTLGRPGARGRIGNRRQTRGGVPSPGRRALRF